MVQCARGDRKNSASCIIFEINKFLIGLELVQERQLQIEAHVSKPEDDTNCSVSSIEEDFLTASEHLEEENEADEYKTGKSNETERNSAIVHDRTAMAIVTEIALHFNLCIYLYVI